MIVPFSVTDFIARATSVYAERVGVVDEPDQPATSWGDVTYGRVGELARAQAARLDAMGIGVGERVAYVSHNSARLLTAFFGVCGSGRVLVPINFRLSPGEVAYIVKHSGARVLFVDPELTESLADVTAEHTFVIGDDDAYLFDTEPQPWEPDENATATINYTSGTTARPKGVQVTHRNIWTNAVTFALHAGVTDRDVYLHTLPMFHCNGWGMPFAMTGMGVPHIVLRKIDGAEILRRVAKHGVTVMCAAPAVVAAVLDAAQTWEGEIPGRDRVRIIVAGAPPPTKTVARVRAELGWEFIQIYGLTETSPLLTVNRMRSEWDDLTPEEQATRLVRAGQPVIGCTVRRRRHRLPVVVVLTIDDQHLQRFGSPGRPRDPQAPQSEEPDHHHALRERQHRVSPGCSFSESIDPPCQEGACERLRSQRASGGNRGDPGIGVESSPRCPWSRSTIAGIPKYDNAGRGTDRAVQFSSWTPMRDPHPSRIFLGPERGRGP